MPRPAPVRIGSSPTVRKSAAKQNVTFRVQSEGIRGTGPGAVRPGGRRHRSGEVVRQSGIYEVIHDRNHREAHEVVMISGECFPDCETCKEKVGFRLVRTAPYIFQDEDFEEGA